jgi:hypothetical protein
MGVSLSRDGLYVIFRYGTDTHEPLGFVIKPRSRKLFSERYTQRGFDFGPLYFRTYARRPQ